MTVEEGATEWEVVMEDNTVLEDNEVKEESAEVLDVAVPSDITETVLE